jgi:hypothetical protein
LLISGKLRKNSVNSSVSAYSAAKGVSGSSIKFITVLVEAAGVVM